MTALRALLVAVFGGFIGAAPAAPVYLAASTTGGHGHVTDAHAHSQRRDGDSHRPEAAEPPAAAAPPGLDGLVRPDPAPATAVATPAAPVVWPASWLRGATPRAEPTRAPAAARAAVRAGLVDLPPPSAC